MNELINFHLENLAKRFAGKDVIVYIIKSGRAQVIDNDHFSETHGYRNVRIVSDPFFEENHMSVNYGMELENFVGKKSNPVQIEFKGDVHD